MSDTERLVAMMSSLPVLPARDQLADVHPVFGPAIEIDGQQYLAVKWGEHVYRLAVEPAGEHSFEDILYKDDIPVPDEVKEILREHVQRDNPAGW